MEMYTTRSRPAAFVSLRNCSTSVRDSARDMLALALRKYAEIE